MKQRWGRLGRWVGAESRRGSRHSVPSGTFWGSQSPEQNSWTVLPMELWISDMAERGGCREGERMERGGRGGRVVDGVRRGAGGERGDQ